MRYYIVFVQLSDQYLFKPICIKFNGTKKHIKNTQTVAKNKPTLFKFHVLPFLADEQYDVVKQIQVQSF